jgi:GNAT superfamily N-acetyltransferase
MPRFMDRDLARQLERTEGAVGASYTAVPQAAERGATWQDFDGTYAIFDAAESPLTQTFGLGLFAPATPDRLAAIEAFFAQRGAAAVHEVSPLAGVETAALLVDRGYRPIELSTVLVQDLEPGAAAPVSSALRVRTMEPDDHGDWAAWINTMVAGWSSELPDPTPLRAIAELAAGNRAMTHFLVEQDAAPVATASLGIHDGVALLAGASTVPAARGRGIQALLLAARLAEASRRGCALAMMVTAPGTASQRNAERRGFRVAYTRTKWRLGSVP